jgi:peptidoglycan/LPS O-acetylase OafA/YrhL
MGTLRIILAFAVLNVHANIFARFPIGGDTAVQMFFIISGYYMAMVLNEKYVPGRANTWAFWQSRALRIFPAYYTVLAAVLIAGAIADLAGHELPPFAAWKVLLGSAGQRSVASLLGAQITLVGLDATNFAAFDSAMRLIFTADFWQQAFPAWRTLLVPQAWTLATEWYFYLIAPFVVRRPLSLLVTILGGSLALRVLGAAWLEWRTDPWSFRFFPFELSFFMAGTLAYRIGKIGAAPGSSLTVLRFFIAAVVAAAAAIGRIAVAGHSQWIAPLLLALLFLGIDRLFEATRRIRLDRLAGELSYPLYLCHVLVIWIVAGVLPASAWNRPIVLLASLLFAVLLYWAVDRRVDALRHRRFNAFQPVV